MPWRHGLPNAFWRFHPPWHPSPSMAHGPWPTFSSRRSRNFIPPRLICSQLICPRSKFRRVQRRHHDMTIHDSKKLIICHISWDFMVINSDISSRDYTHHVHLLGSSWDFPGWKFMVIEPTRRLSTMAPSNAVRNGTIWPALCASSISSMTSVRSKKGLEPYIHPYWWFPEMVVPPVIIHFHRIVHQKTIHGCPHFWKPP